MEEVWKDITGYEGLYQVSNLGRVRTLNYRGKKGVVMVVKQFSTGPVGYANYKSVQLSKDGIRKTYRVHRLVAEMFVDNPFNLPEVNHKDEDPSNNRADNLEFSDRIYQMNYGTVKERIASHFEKPVVQIKNGLVVSTYKSIKNASETTGIHCSNIARCCNNSKYRHTAGGYQWQFATSPTSE